MSSKMSVFDALSVIADFDDSLADGTRSPEDRRKLFVQHLQRMDKLNFTIPQFKEGLDWLNVSEPISWENSLNGQLVILDFFTYCCVNCMHIFPDLKILEEQNGPESGVAVIGVHSAKFANEKVTANILSAVLRYGISHPVVNDSEATLWQELSVSCWPTLLFVGPSNQLLYTLVGEGHLKELLEFVEIAKEFYTSKGSLKPKPLPIHLEDAKREKSPLNFPGKIFFWLERDYLVISDTGNHRVVLTDKNGVVQETIGSGVSGFKDGTFQEASFSSPQGIACLGHRIFVADTGNHAIRVLDLSSKKVTTLVGTGRQGMDKEGGKESTQQEIASPWDVALGHSLNKAGDSDPDVLYIAMAGTHQIWVYFLQDAQWYKGRSYNKDVCVRFAGSGAEENRNNSYPEKAGFAQPSGLAMSATRHALYLADSESSSIRSVSLKDGKVAAVVGAEKDPMNLFASGDVDGKGVTAKLQHPLGVALISPEGPLVVADSYNHKLKTVDLETNTCESLSLHPIGQQALKGTSTFGDLNEPGSVAVDQTSGTIYVADTNNHAIKVVHYQEKTISQLPIIFPDEERLLDETVAVNTSGLDLALPSLPEVTVLQTETSMVLSIPLGLAPGEHLNKEAPNSYRIEVPDGSPKQSTLIPDIDCKGKLKPSSKDSADIAIILSSDRQAGTYTYQVSVQVFVCLDEGDVCLPPRTTRFKQTVLVK